MIQLTARMQAIADAAVCYAKEHKKDHSVAADIGCDHAFVSIALAESGTFAGVIACDVVPGPLKIAERNIREAGLIKKVSLRKGDGFAPIEPGEADVAVIAGMGGHLMEDILRRGRDVLAAGIGLILSPQSEPERVRYYLQEAGYAILRERMIVENNKYYTVITASAGEEAPYTETEAKFGRDNILRKDPVFTDYVKDLMEKNRQVAEKLADKNSSHPRLAELDHDYEEMVAILRS